MGAAAAHKLPNIDWARVVAEAEQQYLDHRAAEEGRGRKREAAKGGSVQEERSNVDDENAKRTKKMAHEKDIQVEKLRTQSRHEAPEKEE